MPAAPPSICSTAEPGVTGTSRARAGTSRRFRPASGGLALVLAPLALLLLVIAARAELTIDRLVNVAGNTTNVQVAPFQDYTSTLNWTNNGLTNISGTSVRIKLSSIPDNEFVAGQTAAYLTYNFTATNEVLNAVVYLTNASEATFVDAVFAVTNQFLSPGLTNSWDLLVAADDTVGPVVFNLWRLILTGGAVTNGTIEAGAGGIVSGTDGYTVDATISAGTGTGNNAVTASVTNGQSLNFNGGISGSGELAKTGGGTLSLAGNSTNFSGTFSVGGGTADITTTTALGGGTLLQADGSSTVIFSAGGNYTNNMTLANVSFTNGGNTLSGAITNNNTTYDVASGTTNTISGVMTGSGGLTKDGDGALVIAGSTNNTFTGATVVDNGSLVLSNSIGNAIHSSESITVNSGGTLVLGASDQIEDGIGLTLNGGTFLVGAATVSESLGTLTLSASSTIDFGDYGTSVRQITFANSSTISWATNALLTITNWQGVAATQSAFTKLVFGGEEGLNSEQRGQIQFAGYEQGSVLVEGELAPIPEAPVVWGAVAVTGFIFWRERRRLLGLFGRGLGKKG